MYVLSWNVQRLGNLRTFHDLRNLLQDKTPYIVFLIETRMTAVQMGGLVRRLGVGGVLYVPREWFFGGLYFLWNTGLQVVLLSSSSGHIDARVTFPNSFVTQITRFYGHPHLTRRIYSWELLRRLS
ncbi:unnamed protein product [Prunus armeniaca]|uniref:Endonuclease/exonuclease/phosphatase domain-containing protein n=1 Tax=Prunus armeniaca TaxID=36596 RepID=A0A6J5WX81_PRUAR|nr:unnamed protein product [Prunus armeniaca]CAB4303664.1 unnamed protein product [Prunus armeniaca]